MAKKIIRVLLIFLIIAAIGVYVVDIVVNGASITKNLFRMLVVVLALAVSFIRTFTSSGSSRGLSFYEKTYEKEIGGAFDRSPNDKKKLLTAIRYYNENKLKKAANILIDLQRACRRNDDEHAVGLFLALCFTDMRLYAEAIHVYEGLVSRNIASSTVYGNLGHVYYQVGEAQLAAENYEKAIETDPHNPYPYNNLAKFYFDEYQLEEAKEYAKKALEINRKVYQASTLLAIIYSLEGNSTEADKYSHMAVSSGQNPQKLKAAIEHYKSLENEDEE